MWEQQSMPVKRVLYIQHAGTLGGSCVSLRNTVRSLDHTRYSPRVALAQPSDQVLAYYRDAGVRPISVPSLPVINHTTGAEPRIYKPSTWRPYLSAIRGWNRWNSRLRELVAESGADIVHLNSVTLFPCAYALHRARIPFVWHIREHPPRLPFSFRTLLIRHLLRTTGNEVIFLSEADRQAWVGGTRGMVLPNFVEDAEYEHSEELRRQGRSSLGISADAPVVLYLGGFSKLKGIFPLLGALKQVVQELPTIRCIMPGTIYPDATGLALRIARTVLPRLGSGTTVQKATELIERHGLKGVVVGMPFSDDVPSLIAASDLLVFPAIRPHFARPVIEASAMGRPVVASDLAGIKELVGHNDTGLLVPADDETAMADAMIFLLRHPSTAKRMAETGRERAIRKFDRQTYMAHIIDTYDRVLH